MKKNAENEETTQKSPVAAEKEPTPAETRGADVPAQEATAAQDPDAQGAVEDQAKAAASADATRISELTARIGELEKLNATIQDQYLRKAADFDNYRKRMIKEKQDAVDYANTNLLVDLVQVLDDFDRAIASTPASDAASASNAFADGVSMIRKQLGGLLESKYGLAYYEVKGVPFDPTIHEALGSVPSADVKEPTVAEECVKGYKLKDRVIRVAKVIVHMPAEPEKK